VIYEIGKDDPLEKKFHQAIKVERIKSPVINVEQLVFAF